MTNTNQVRRQLDEIPMLAALLPEFAIPGSSALDGGGSGSTDPAQAPLRLEILDLLDGRDKTQLRSHRDARRDHPLPGEAWVWRDGRTGRGVEQPAGLEGGVFAIINSWSKLADGQMFDAGIIHDELEVEACTATCDQAPERAKRCRRQGPCDDQPRRHWRPATVTSEVDFLIEHFPWVSEQEWFEEFAGQITALNSDLKTAIRWPRTPAVTCQNCGWAMQPKGDYDTERHRYPWYSCPGCGNTLTTANEVERAEQEARDSVTLRYAAEQIGVPYPTLRYWKQRGLVSPIGKDQRGKVYSLSALRIVAYRQRAQVQHP